MRPTVIEAMRSTTCIFEIALAAYCSTLAAFSSALPSAMSDCGQSGSATSSRLAFQLGTHSRVYASETIHDHFETLDRAIDVHFAALNELAGEEQCEIAAYPGAQKLLAGLPPYW